VAFGPGVNGWFVGQSDEMVVHASEVVQKVLVKNPIPLANSKTRLVMFYTITSLVFELANGIKIRDD